MPQSGARISRSAAISPGAEMPASKTATAVPGAAVSTASGTPSWLLKLPGLAAVEKVPSSCA